MLISLGLVLPISDYRLQITCSCKGSCLSLLTTCLVVDQMRVLFILLEKICIVRDMKSLLFMELLNALLKSNIFKIVSEKEMFLVKKEAR